MAFSRKILAAGRRAGAAFARGRCGSAAVEFAMVVPLFVVIVLATFQVAVIYLANAYLETASEDAARLVLTNQTGTMTVAQFQSALCANLTALFNCNNVMISLQPASSTTSISTVAPTFNANGTLQAALPYTQPSPGQIAVLQVIYEWPVIGLPLGWNFGNLGNGTFLMMSTQVFIVEAS